jgi:hypothetical protein
MYRDFAADRSVGADERSSTYRESAGTVLKSFHVASATAEEDAELIMRRLVRNYLERSPIGSWPRRGATREETDLATIPRPIERAPVAH